eukprot:1151780-Pelagomonas_calceolata.AAC.1
MTHESVENVYIMLHRVLLSLAALRRKASVFFQRQPSSCIAASHQFRSHRLDQPKLCSIYCTGQDSEQ